MTFLGIKTQEFSNDEESNLASNCGRAEFYRVRSERASSTKCGFEIGGWHATEGHLLCCHQSRTRCTAVSSEQSHARILGRRCTTTRSGWHERSYRRQPRAWRKRRQIRQQKDA